MSDVQNDSSTGRRTGAVVDERQLALVNAIARIATLDLELQPMLQRITDAMATAFGWEFVALVTIDEENRRFVCQALTSQVETDIHIGYSRPLGSGVVGEVAATAKPILLDDVSKHSNYIETMEGARSEVCLPIVHRDRVVAVLNLESRRLAAFSEQLPLLQTIADQVAGAIASAGHYAELARRASLLEMLGEVVRIALEAGKISNVMDRIVRYVHARFPLSTTAIVLLSDDRREGVLAAYAGSQLNQPVGYRFPVTVGVVGRALRTGEEQLVLDVSADPDYVALGEDVRSELVVPIRFRGETLGVFDFDSQTPEAFSTSNVIVFRTIADQVAGAIHLTTLNERLLETTLRLTEANSELERMSMTDPLTGVANRRMFDQSLATEWDRHRRAGSRIGCLMIDVDFFKAYNDRYGHPAGDQCLKQIATTLRGNLRRATDILARVGGEEFAVLLLDTDQEHAHDHAEALRRAIEGLSITHEDSPFARVTVSIGTAVVRPSDDCAVSDLTTLADDALYEAKSAGRNRSVLADA